MTNLNDTGAGSLRAACNASGARHIVFDVSGTINLATDIACLTPNFSIWGETAPAPGIQLRNFGLVIRTSNFIIRHLRIRPEAGPDIRDCFRIVRFTGEAFAVGNGIIANCTAQWAGDECMSAFPSIGTPITDVTFQANIMAESMEDGMLIADDVDRISVIYNLLAKNHARHPRIHTFAKLEIVNNISYNCENDDVDVGGTSATGGPTPCFVSVINNRYIDGPNSTVSNGCIHWEAANWDDGTSRLYHAGNVYVGSINRPFLLNDNPFNPVTATPPITSGTNWIRPADAAFETWLLARVGARPNARDSAETRVISEVSSRTGALATYHTLAAYGNPVVYTGTTSTFVPCANPNGDGDKDGYTNVEEQIHALSAGFGA